MVMGIDYDIVRNNYAKLRTPNQRIANIIESALGPANDFEYSRGNRVHHRRRRADYLRRREGGLSELIRQ